MKIPKGGFGVKVLIGCGIDVTSPHHRRLFFSGTWCEEL